MADHRGCANRRPDHRGPSIRLPEAGDRRLDAESTHAAYVPPLARTSITFITIDDRPVCRQFHGEIARPRKRDGTWLLGRSGEAARDGPPSKPVTTEPAAS